MKHRILAVLMVIGGLIGYSAASQATLMYTCPVDTATCNGNLYAVGISSLGGTSYQATVSIQVTNAYTGNKWTDLLNSIQLKNFAPSYSNVSLTGVPSNTTLGNWSVIDNELNANGCAGGSSSTVCIFWDSTAPDGAGFSYPGTSALPSVLTWTFTFDAPSGVYDSAHLKYLYVTSSGKKIGSLGSFNIEVPEPATPALMGLGLLMLGFMARRRKGRA